MKTQEIDEALAQVRLIQELILDREYFRGYSGAARITAGTAALAGMLALATGRVPADPMLHLRVWAMVMAIGLLANYGALLSWYLKAPASRRALLKLKPAVDAVPALAVGGLLSLVAIQTGAWDLLFGIWMCLYGLTHTASRHTLPRANYLLGLAYIACGAIVLLSPGMHFLNPWPMGLVFFTGETIGGWILIKNRLPQSCEEPV